LTGSRSFMTDWLTNSILYLQKIILMRKLLILILLLSFSFFQTLSPQSKEWKLVWSEEFNYQGLPDTTKWNFETKGNETGWGNNEKQFYTDRDTSNAIVKNGFLYITARKEEKGNKPYTSARLSTSEKYNFTYGKVDVRAKLPSGTGTWPAIWMLGQSRKTTKWPDCGEIDIMEHVGYDKDSIHGTVHTAAYNHIKRTQKGSSIFITDPYENFHLYSIIWDKEKIEFLLDNQVYFVFKNEKLTKAEWPFDDPFYLILNVAIGGNWGGKKGIDDTIFPVSMVIDYVRVFQIR
jgi:beta-glucanase (GH16 family)